MFHFFATKKKSLKTTKVCADFFPLAPFQNISEKARDGFIGSGPCFFAGITIILFGAVSFHRTITPFLALASSNVVVGDVISTLLNTP
jgi:hypothetical protein